MLCSEMHELLERCLCFSENSAGGRTTGKGKSKARTKEDIEYEVTRAKDRIYAYRLRFMVRP
jgi:hypothetical protein